MRGQMVNPPNPRGAERRGRCRDRRPSPSIPSASLPFEMSQKSTGAGARTPPQGHLLRKPSWTTLPLPMQTQSPRSVRGERTDSPPEGEKPPRRRAQPARAASPFAQRWPLGSVQTAFAFSKPRRLVREAMRPHLAYNEPSPAASRQGLRRTRPAIAPARRLPCSSAKGC